MRRRAFTLVEVLVAMSVMGLVMAGAYQLFFYGTRAAGTSTAAGEGVDVATSVFLQLSQHVRYAHRVTEPATGREGDRLVFSSVSTGEWAFTFEDGDLVLEQTFGPERQVLARGLSALRFHRPTDIQDFLEVELTVGTGSAAREYRTALYTRGAVRIGVDRGGP